MSSPVASAWRREGARVVFYGTSLTRSGGWAEVLTAEMQRQSPSLTAVNTAEGGRESRWGLTHFPERVLAHRPSVVLLEFAINDAVERFALPPDESASNLEAMLDLLSQAQPHAVPVLQVMNPVVDRPPGHDGHRPFLSAYEARWREVARRRNVTLVDHAAGWADLWARDERAFRTVVPDGLHPTLAGYQRFVLPALRRMLGLPNVPEPEKL